MATINKPTMRMVWRGQKGNKFRTYQVTNEGKTYYHGENKASALRQFEAAKRTYKIRMSRKKRV